MALAATAAVAGGTAVAAYLNGKFHLKKDLDVLFKLKAGEREYNRAVKEDRLSLWYFFAEKAKRYPDTLCIWSRANQYTWKEAHNACARYAQYFLSLGVQPGQLVAFYMLNSAEYMIAWMALWSIGCAPATINYHLEGDALMHCLKISGAGVLLVDEGDGCIDRIRESSHRIEQELKMNIQILDQTLKSKIGALEPNVPDEKYRKAMKGEFPCSLCYTSGTTGLPKGCAFTVARVRIYASARKLAFSQKAGPGGDRWYIPMPLYHGTGGMCAIGCLLSGVGLAVGRRFSVTNFWADVHDSESTFFVYVGETARYLLAAPPSPLDKGHKVRCMYGNGLRPDIWDKFRERFDVPEVAEFFNSTEGVFSLINWDRGDYQAACVGHHGAILRKFFHNVYIPVAIDHETGDIWRDPVTGFAKRNPYNEGGEMIVAVPNEQAFQGYWRSPEATAKKFIRDVFRKGDLYYRSSDALRRTDDGRWFFMDRLGDTFRWKSENVSTAEVAEVLGRYPGVIEANVYGVLVPKHDGRAGCAAVFVRPEDRPNFNYNGLLKHARANLPRYAVPIFIRIVDASSHIHNNKQNKVPLRAEGVDPAAIGSKDPEGRNDKFLWIPPREERYADFGQSDWDSLIGGQARL